VGPALTHGGRSSRPPPRAAPRRTGAAARATLRARCRPNRCTGRCRGRCRAGPQPCLGSTSRSPGSAGGVRARCGTGKAASRAPHRADTG
jgi:hypothetical protein